MYLAPCGMCKKFTIGRMTSEIDDYFWTASLLGKIVISIGDSFDDSVSIVETQRCVLVFNGISASITQGLGDYRGY